MYTNSDLLEIARISAVISDFFMQDIYKQNDGYIASVDTIASIALKFFEQYKDAQWEELLNNPKTPNICCWDDFVIQYAYNIVKENASHHVADPLELNKDMRSRTHYILSKMDKSIRDAYKKNDYITKNIDKLASQNVEPLPLIGEMMLDATRMAKQIARQMNHLKKGEI